MTLLLVLVWLYVSIRLLCYQRNGARYRRTISILAWCITVMAFSRAVWLGWSTGEPTPLELAAALVIAAGAYRTKGNVAGLTGPVKIRGLDG